MLCPNKLVNNFSAQHTLQILKIKRKFYIRNKLSFFDAHQVMKLVVVTKILQEAHYASWNFSSDH